MNAEQTARQGTNYFDRGDEVRSTHADTDSVTAFFSCLSGDDDAFTVSVDDCAHSEMITVSPDGPTGRIGTLIQVPRRGLVETFFDAVESESQLSQYNFFDEKFEGADLKNYKSSPPIKGIRVDLKSLVMPSFKDLVLSDIETFSNDSFESLINDSPLPFFIVMGVVSGGTNGGPRYQHLYHAKDAVKWIDDEDQVDPNTKLPILEIRYFSIFKEFTESDHIVDDFGCYERSKGVEANPVTLELLRYATLDYPDFKSSVLPLLVLSELYSRGANDIFVETDLNFKPVKQNFSKSLIIRKAVKDIINETFRSIEVDESGQAFGTSQSLGRKNITEFREDDTKFFESEVVYNWLQLSVNTLINKVVKDMGGRVRSAIKSSLTAVRDMRDENIKSAKNPSLHFNKM